MKPESKKGKPEERNLNEKTPTGKPPKMKKMTFADEDQTAQPLNVHGTGLEPGIVLGTIEEGREGSTSGESEDGITTNLSDRPKDLTVTKSFSKTDSKKTWDSEDLYNLESEEFSTALKDQVKSGHSDIDGGWAYIVWICVFFLFAVTSGLLNTTGIFYVRMLEVFGHSRSYTAWMGSLINAFFMLGGPLSSVFIQRFGCRASLMLGSLVMAIGYILSSITNSLQLLFFTYGIVVACGMNLCYSGQIIALAQYFHKYHSLATSTSMAGIGAGMFAFGKIFEYCIEEYGWRASFIFAAGFALQNMVLGALIFPLPSSTQYPSSPVSMEELNMVQPSESAYMLKPIFSEKNLINRSVSSLLLSAEAGYLSHSILNVNPSKSGLRLVPTESGLKSNHASFCSKNSHYGVMSLKSNPYSFHTKDEGGQSGLRSNHQSFSKKHSSVDLGIGKRCGTNPYSIRASDSSNSIAQNLTGLLSNPSSFCSRGSHGGLNLLQNQVHFNKISQYQEGWKDVNPGPSKKCFTIHDADCKLSCCIEEDEELYSPESELNDGFALPENNARNKWMKFTSLFRLSKDSPLGDVRLWLMSTGVFFCMLGTLLMFIIYKDLCEFLNVEEYYTTCLCLLGVGDIVGRISGGILSTFQWARPILFYSVSIFICAGIIGCYSLVNNGAGILAISLFYGIIYGGQNVLLAVAPTTAFGINKLAEVFGYILFMGGLGALFGAPMAGWIVDQTGSFYGVIAISAGNCVVSAILMLCCSIIHEQRAKVTDNAVNVQV